MRHALERHFPNSSRERIARTPVFRWQGTLPLAPRYIHRLIRHGPSAEPNYIVGSVPIHICISHASPLTPPPSPRHPPWTTRVTFSSDSILPRSWCRFPAIEFATSLTNGESWFNPGASSSGPDPERISRFQDEIAYCLSLYVASRVAIDILLLRYTYTPLRALFHRLSPRIFWSRLLETSKYLIVIFVGKKDVNWRKNIFNDLMWMADIYLRVKADCIIELCLCSKWRSHHQSSRNMSDRWRILIASLLFLYRRGLKICSL